MLTLRPYQQEVLDYLHEAPTQATLIAGDVGIGKTLVSVEYTKAIGAKSVLIIGPLNTYEDTWKETFEGQEAGLPVYQILSTNKNFEKFLAKEPGVFFVGREFFTISGTSLTPQRKKDGTVSKGRERRYDWSKVKPDIIIVDEIHSAANRKSAMYSVMKKIKAPHKLGLSGTWMGDKFQGAWSISRWLFPENVDASFWRWANKWAYVENDIWAGKVVKEEIAPGAFVESLPSYIYVPSTMPPHENYEIRVQLSGEQLRQYTETEYEALVWIEDNPLVIQFPIVRRARLRQMALGTVKVFEENGRPFFDDSCDSTKLDAAVQYCEQNPDENILFATSSRSFSEVAARRLGGRAWNGSTSGEERNAIKKDFGKGTKYIVAVHRAIAEGTDGLQHNSSTLILFDEQDYNVLNTQVIGRLNRPPQEKIVKVIRIMADNTIDDGSFDKRVKKAMSVQASVSGGK